MPTIALDDLLEQAVVNGLAVTLEFDLPQHGLGEAGCLVLAVLDVLEEVSLPCDKSKLTSASSPSFTHGVH